MGNDVIALWLAGARETGVRIPPPSFSALRNRPAVPDAAHIRQIRQRLDLSQQAFADLLNVSVAAVRSWEQGVRTPDGASIRLLDIAERHPEALLSA